MNVGDSILFLNIGKCIRSLIMNVGDIYTIFKVVLVK